jgi:hypothetical protein
MLRLVGLAGLVAVIWFTINDSPGGTRAGSPLLPANVAAPAMVVQSIPAVVAQSTPEKMILAQARTEPSAKPRPVRQAKPPTRVRVYSESAYPGRNAVRHCVDWYAEERRPSGAVVVPRMRCRWVRR